MIFESLSAISCFGLIAALYSGIAVIMKAAVSVCFLIAWACGYVIYRENKRLAVKVLTEIFLSAVPDKEERMLFVIGVQ